MLKKKIFCEKRMDFWIFYAIMVFESLLREERTKDDEEDR